MTTPEKTLVKKIRDALKRAYPQIFIYKSHGGAFQRVGLPDLVMCVDGKFIGIEVKRPDTMNTVTTLQKQTLADINAAGGLGFVCCDPAEAVQVVRDWLER